MGAMLCLRLNVGYCGLLKILFFHHCSNTKFSWYNSAEIVIMLHAMTFILILAPVFLLCDEEIKIEQWLYE